MQKGVQKGEWLPNALFIVEVDELSDKRKAVMLTKGCDKELRMSQGLTKAELSGRCRRNRAVETSWHHRSEPRRACSSELKKVLPRGA